MDINEAFAKIKIENRNENIKSIMEIFSSKFKALERNIFPIGKFEGREIEGLEGIIVIIGNNIEYATKSILIVDVNHQDMYFLNQTSRERNHDFRDLIIKDFMNCFNRKILEEMRGFNDYYTDDIVLVPDHKYLIPKSDICFKFDSYENLYKYKLDYIKRNYERQIEHIILNEKKNKERTDSISAKYKTDIDESNRIERLSLEKRSKKDTETLRSIRKKYNITHYTGIDYKIERVMRYEIQSESNNIILANQERIKEYVDSKIKLIDLDAIISMNSIIFDRNYKDPTFKFTNQFEKTGVVPYGIDHKEIDSNIESDKSIFIHNKAIIEQEETIRFNPTKNITLKLKRGVYEFNYINLIYEE